MSGLNWLEVSLYHQGVAAMSDYTPEDEASATGDWEAAWRYLGYDNAPGDNDGIREVRKLAHFHATAREQGRQAGLEEAAKKAREITTAQRGLAAQWPARDSLIAKEHRDIANGAEKSEAAIRALKSGPSREEAM